MESLTISQVDGTSKIVLSFPNLDVNDHIEVIVKGRNGRVLNGAVNDHHDAHDGGPPSYYSVFPPGFVSPSELWTIIPAHAGEALSSQPFPSPPSGIVAKVVESFWAFLMTRSCSQPFGAALIYTPRAQHLHNLMLIQHIHTLIHALSALTPFAVLFFVENPSRAVFMMLAKWIFDYVFLHDYTFWMVRFGQKVLEKLSGFPILGWLIRRVQWLAHECRGGQRFWQFCFVTLQSIVIGALVGGKKESECSECEIITALRKGRPVRTYS